MSVLFQPEALLLVSDPPDSGGDDDPDEPGDLDRPEAVRLDHAGAVAAVVGVELEETVAHI